MPEWTLGHRLWRSRRLTGETQAELAARLGIGLKTIKEAEADKRIPKRAVILGWAVATGVDPDWLEHGDGDDGHGGAPDTGPNILRYFRRNRPLALAA